MLQRRLILIPTLVAALLAGCTESYRQPLPHGVVNNPILIDSDFDAVFRAADRTLRDHRFVIYRQDPRRGELITEPLTGQQFWEYWRSDAAGLHNQLESSTHTVLRTVEVRVFPARDEQGQPVPRRHYMEVRAHTDRLSVPEHELTAANQVSTTYRARRSISDTLFYPEGGKDQAKPVYLGRDAQLEDWLIRDILRKIYRLPPGGQLPEVTDGSQPPATQPWME